MAKEQIKKLAQATFNSNVLAGPGFFGGMFEMRGGKAVTPGGQRSASAWAELVGASPDQGATFFFTLPIP